MNRQRLTHLITLTCSLAVISTTGCGDKAKPGEPALPVVSAVDVKSGAKTPAEPGSPTMVAVADKPGVAATQWADVKDLTFDLRVQFMAGLKLLNTKVDAQVGELTAKRATMANTGNTQAWDVAMKEMTDARSYLLSSGTELEKATRETWDQGKEKVGQAWVRVQDAYAKVKASTTN